MRTIHTLLLASCLSGLAVAQESDPIARMANDLCACIEGVSYPSPTTAARCMDELSDTYRIEIIDAYGIDPVVAGGRSRMVGFLAPLLAENCPILLTIKPDREEAYTYSDIDSKPAKNTIRKAPALDTTAPRLGEIPVVGRAIGTITYLGDTNSEFAVGLLPQNGDGEMRLLVVGRRQIDELNTGDRVILTYLRTTDREKVRLEVQIIEGN